MYTQRDLTEMNLEESANKAIRKLEEIKSMKSAIRDRLFVGLTMFNGATQKITKARIEYIAECLDEIIDDNTHDARRELEEAVEEYVAFDNKCYKEDNKTY